MQQQKAYYFPKPSRPDFTNERLNSLSLSHNYNVAKYQDQNRHVPPTHHANHIPLLLRCLNAYKGRQKIENAPNGTKLFLRKFVEGVCRKYPVDSNILNEYMLHVEREVYREVYSEQLGERLQGEVKELNEQLRLLRQRGEAMQQSQQQHLADLAELRRVHGAQTQVLRESQ